MAGLSALREWLAAALRSAQAPESVEPPARSEARPTPTKVSLQEVGDTGGAIGLPVAHERVRTPSASKVGPPTNQDVSVKVTRTVVAPPAGGLSNTPKDVSDDGEQNEIADPAREDAKLEYERLRLWAQKNWDDPDALDKAYQRFHENVFEWRRLLGNYWEGPKVFEAFNTRAREIRPNRISELQKRREQMEERGRRRRELCEAIAATWDDVPRLRPLVEKLLALLNSELGLATDAVSDAGSGSEGVRPGEGAAAKAAADTGRSTVADKRVAVGAGGKGRSASGPAWPAEAKRPQAEALEGDQFDYRNGVLSYMGYRVGHAAGLETERRRGILIYVLLGRLPQVNDRAYMRTWGRPGTTTRLRKLANAIAAFARNARRKRRKSLTRAISEWEADLAYLKKHYFDRRNRDWRWPETMPRKRP